MKKLMIVLLAVAISLPSFAQKTVMEGLDQLEKRYGAVARHRSGLRYT